MSRRSAADRARYEARWRIPEPPRPDPKADEAVWRALTFARERMADAVKAKTYRTAGWFLAVALRAEPAFRDLPAARVVELVGSSFARQRWSFHPDDSRGPWELFMRPEDSLGHPTDPQSDLLAAWDRVPVERTVDAAFAAGEADPVTVPGLPAGEAWAPLRRFASTLAHLAARTPPGKSFAVPSRLFGERLGVARRTVSNWLLYLIGCKLLTLAKPASQGLPRLAAEYLWHGPFPPLRDAGEARRTRADTERAAICAEALCDLWPNRHHVERDSQRQRIREALADAVALLPDPGTFRASVCAYVARWQSDSQTGRDSEGKRRIIPPAWAESPAEWIGRRAWRETRRTETPPAGVTDDDAQEVAN